MKIPLMIVLTSMSLGAVRAADGNKDLLPACEKMGDLLCKVFGDEPGQLDINASSAHVGMASGSVLGPMVQLYRMTGEKRYLDFAKYVLRAWEHPNGPKIVSVLLEQKRVEIVITVDTESAAPFAFKARVPAWCRETTVKVNGKPVKALRGKDGYAAIKRTWAKGDKVELNFKLEPRVIVGDHTNVGKIAIMYGPLVLAADEATLGNEGLAVNAISINKPDLASLAIKPEPAPEKLKTWPHALVFRSNILVSEQPQEIRLMTFADAGSFDESYKIWLPLSRNVLVDGTESRSRKGDGTGSIIDENEATFANTSDGTWPKEDWFAVTLIEAKTISRVVFMHGKTLNVGGWFDASAGKPRIQIQTQSGGAWEDAGELKDYPATTGDKASPLQGGESFQCPLAAPVKAFGVRITGKPSFGGNPNQAFSTCAELQAFAK